MKVITGKSALELLAGESYGGEINVVCPNCGSHYTQVENAGTLIGSDPHEATVAYEGTAPTGTTPERRSAVEVVFNCEGCPQLFRLVIQQHKGINNIEIHADLPRPQE